MKTTKHTMKVTFLSAVVGLGSQIALQAALIPVTLVDGDWSNAVADTPGGVITIVNSGVNGGTSTARWGEALTAGGQSGYDFASAVTPFLANSDGSQFPIGEFTHLNFAIIGTALDSIDLNVNVGTAFNVSATFNIDHNETTNDPGDVDDIVTIENPVVNQPFVYEGVNYFFNLIGFSTDLGTTVTDEFLTKEGQANKAVLYGRITAAPVGVPESGSTLAILGLTLIGFGAVRRITK